MSQIEILLTITKGVDPMSVVSILGVDLAKNIFQLHGADERGAVVFQRQVRRSDLIRRLANLPPCVVAMEACAGAHHWGREFAKLGHSIRLIAPQFVKPYVKSNKNDRNDAEAIAEAATRPQMRFVPVKGLAQQDMQSMHRMRSRLVGNRTALINEIRALAHEYGVVLSKSPAKLRSSLASVINSELLTATMRLLMERARQRLSAMDEELKWFNTQIKLAAESSEACQRISEVEGIGPITATALYAAMPNPKAFRNGRQFAAFLGLVPKQNSTGGKTKLLGISKRGDTYLRTLLIHGARAVVRHAAGKTDSRSVWVQKTDQTRGRNKACVAVANKNARIVWALLANETRYRAAS